MVDVRERYHPDGLTQSLSLFAEATRTRIEELTRYFLGRRISDQAAAAHQAVVAIGNVARKERDGSHAGSPVDTRRSLPGPEAELGGAAPRSGATPQLGTADAISPRWMPWIFAAKTTASGLLAL